MEKNEVVMITWVDANNNPDWREPNECYYHHMEITSVGILIEETDRGYAIAQSTNNMKGYKPCANVFSIPKICVTSIKKLKPYIDI